MQVDNLKRDLAVESVRARADRSTIVPMLAGADWASFLDRADAHGLTPLIAHRWLGLGVMNRVPGDVRKRLRAAHRDNSERNAIVRGEVAEYWRLFQDVGIPAIVLKGWPLVEMLYESPALRPINDVDVLVPLNEARSALRVLEAAGLEPLPRNREAWVQKHLPGYWRLSGREIIYPLTNLFDPGHPRSVEIHVRLWEKNFRGLQLNDLFGIWGRSRIMDTAGCSMRILSLTDAFVHLCVHWACHWLEREARLIQLVDIDRFVRKFGDQIDWPLAWEISQAARVARLVSVALDAAQRVLGAPVPDSEVTGRLRAACPRLLRAWLERRIVDDIAAMDPRRPGKPMAYLLTVLSAASARERLGVARYAFLPPRDYIMSRYGLKRRWQAVLFYVPYILSRTLDALKPSFQALKRNAEARFRISE